MRPQAQALRSIAAAGGVAVLLAQLRGGACPWSGGRATGRAGGLAGSQAASAVFTLTRASFAAEGMEAPGAGEEECHGWEGYSPADLPEWLATRNGQARFSDIPTFPAHDVPEQVWEDVTWSERPFLLYGDEHLLGTSSSLSRQAILEEALRRNLSVNVGYSWSIAKNGGEGPERVPLYDYVNKVMHKEWYDGETLLEPAYAFDRRAELPALPGSAHVHPMVKSWGDAALAGPVDRLFMLGAARSAVGWHRHGAALQMTLHGWKRWFFYPVGRYPPGDGPGGGFSITDWLEIVYPTLDRAHAPLECIQGPGDAVYVPAGWYHAVINLADSLAVSVQSRHLPNAPQDALKGITPDLVEQLRTKDPDALSELARAAQRQLELYPENDLHARRTLFYIFSASEPQRAVEIMLQGIAGDPFHVPMQFELAKWLEGQASSGDRFALEAFKGAMRLWEPYLKQNRRNLKALWILSKFYKLVGETAQHQVYQKRLVELHDCGIDR